MPSPVVWTSRGPKDTLTAGERLGAAALPGLFVALTGPLGAGKTVFVKGLARGLEIRNWDLVASPTFNIASRYEGRLPLLHVDAYRLGGADDLIDLGFEEWIAIEGVTALEWADRGEEYLPPDRIELSIGHVGPLEREFSALGLGRFNEGLRGFFLENLAGPPGTTS
ncbi:MAG: tRNA (adenosine(37)-N6)-threonylcarbamoyltransferase complex ATPase subunit type 1 TsaE [Planctomycetota bacterium]|jgi:tRNA threonylcarbamoyladenosine biosynthesis protein TsaE